MPPSEQTPPAALAPPADPATPAPPARPTTTAAAAAATKHNPWVVLGALCLGFFMILLDTTIVNIAIPDLSRGLGASLDDILWVVNAYVLVYAVLLITAGRLGDLYGPKPLFLFGLALFTAASVACGFAKEPNQLIAARVIQGVGGALLTPQTLSVLTVIFPPQRRGAAFGAWGAVAGIATIAGPTLGGLIVTNLGWRWVFFVNLPVGIISLIFATIVMPNLKLNRKHRLDLGGTALVTAGLLLVVFGLIEGESHDWGTVWKFVTIPMVIGAGVLVLGAFLAHQYINRDGEPLVPFSLFRNRNFATMSGVAATIGFGMTGLFLPLVIYMQSALGMSALRAGLTAAPMSLMSMLVAPAAGRFADRIGGKYLLIVGLSLFATGIFVIRETANVDATTWSLLPGFLIAGFGMGLTFAPMQTIAMREVGPAMAGAASGVNSTLRQLGAVIGSAAVGAVLETQLTIKMDEAAQANAAAIGDPTLRARFIDGIHAASSGGLNVGGGSSGGQLPPGLPEAIRAQLVKAGTDTFHTGFTNAMRVTMLLPIAALCVGALVCLTARTAKAGPSGTPTGPDRTDQREAAGAR